MHPERFVGISRGLRAPEGGRLAECSLVRFLHVRVGNIAHPPTSHPPEPRDLPELPRPFQALKEL